MLACLEMKIPWKIYRKIPSNFFNKKFFLYFCGLVKLFFKEVF